MGRSELTAIIGLSRQLRHVSFPCLVSEIFTQISRVFQRRMHTSQESFPCPTTTTIITTTTTIIIATYLSTAYTRDANLQDRHLSNGRSPVRRYHQTNSSRTQPCGSPFHRYHERPRDTRIHFVQNPNQKALLRGCNPMHTGQTRGALSSSVHCTKVARIEQLARARSFTVTFLASNGKCIGWSTRSQNPSEIDRNYPSPGSNLGGCPCAA